MNTKNRRRQNKPAPTAKSQQVSPAEKYNKVYEMLVEDETDIIGQLAYCLYKQSKQKFIQEFEKNNSRRPNDAELNNHVLCSEMPALDMYSAQAARTVKELVGQAATEKEKALEKHFKERLWQFIHRHEPEGFWERKWRMLKSLIHGGVGGVFGNAFTTLLLIWFFFWASSSETRDSFYGSAKENLVTGFAQVIGIEVKIVPAQFVPPEGPSSPKKIASDSTESVSESGT
ncbi:hypothetical protein C4G56_RS23900 [Vibrio parahaemolyticus]|nr:hypothetical protein [Vibrio parahaemolyticus]EJG0655434.1 hypothetical protein [Vibrio parahaemolyticus]EJG0772411.1 hypothetical protein [Vibrio parahaemolyticus]EJG0805297.1 hypothetical protein [Vibrio parahaemolyticus]EJG0899050.1 hypothetical protein [Vibrio parahaemolyticus]